MRDFDRFDRFSANIGEMMERLGIEYDDEIEEYFGPSDWLARAPTAVPRAPAFCPYADRLDGLALDQAAIPPRSHTVH